LSAPALSPELDACRYLYLRRLWEPQDNHLCLIADEGVVDVGEVPDSASSVGPIIIGSQSRAFRLLWKSYVAYSVRNESWAGEAISDRIVSGRLLLTLEKSDYLDHLSRASFYSDMAGIFGAMLHVRLLCLNHIIDVAGRGPPEVESIAPQPRR